MTVRQLLDALGYTGPDHDDNVRQALADRVTLRTQRDRQRRYEDRVAEAHGL